MNKKYCAITGYTAEELLDLRVADVTHPEDRQDDDEAFRRVVRGEATDYRMEKRYVRKDGATVWVNVNMTVTRDEGGRPVRTIATIEDISERKLTERALALRVRIATTFGAASDDEMLNEVLKVVLDVTHSPFGVFGYLDETGAAVASTMIGQTCDDCRISGRTMRFPLEAWRDGNLPRTIRETKADSSDEVAAGVPASHLGFARHMLTPIQSQGRPIGYFQVAHRGKDYTEADALTVETIAAQIAPILTARLQRKLAEEALKNSQAQLLQAQKMEAVGQLAGGVAHDFNNLLQAMLSLTQMQAEHLADPKRLKADTAEMEHLVKRGAALTRQLLLFSRQETVNTERLDLNDVVRDSVTLLRRLLEAHVAIEASLHEGHLPVDADRGQLGQVLLNLAVNAGDAMPAGGRLAIATGSENGTVWVKVTDTGGGIPEAIRDHVFEPFFTTKELGKGTGLGLSVVHGIVVQHGGTVTFESAEGQGTTFAVTLPRAGSGENPVVEIAERGGAPSRGHGELVLVVEDEDSTRQALAEILTLLGYAVTAVGSGEEARRLAAEQPFDLLLTDLMLPGISGGDLAAGLQACWPDLRVVLMSGYAEDAAIRLASPTSPVRFLQKPFDMDTLARELCAALETG